jgi:hypothetical protein
MLIERDIITESSSNLTSFRNTIEIAKSNPLTSIYPPKYPELARIIQRLKTVKEKLEGNETAFNDTRQQLTNKFEQLQAP